jgi:hypothetical protein
MCLQFFLSAVSNCEFSGLSFHKFYSGNLAGGALWRQDVDVWLFFIKWILKVRGYGLGSVHGQGLEDTEMSFWFP